MSLQGQIEEMGLGAVIQTLSLNRYRGTLRIETEDVGSQFFFISEGEIVLVRQVKREPVRLGDLLIRAGKIKEEQLNDALAEQKRKKGTQRIGKTLAGMGVITQEEIETAVRAKFEEDFLDLFLLDNGRFEFIFGLTPEALFSPEERLERVTLSTSGLMMEAMRRLDEWQGMIDGLGSLDTIYRNRMATVGTKIADYEFENINLPARAREDLYELIDGNRSLREVIGTSLRQGLASRLETFKFLDALNKNELVKPMDFKTLLGEAKSALGAGEVQGAAKYIRAILGRKEDLDIGLVKRYLKFLKKQKRPRLAFDEARRFAAQCLANDKNDQAITLFEEAIALYRNVEVIDRLFYTLLRASRRERAVEVGLMVREFLHSDNEVSVATRICKNLKEISAENAEVLELSGLLLKRQERNEEATEELNRALVGIDPEHPRRKPIIEALLELQPDRNELRDEQESIELQHAQSQLRAEIRRRWVFVGATLIMVLVFWRGYAEYDSRTKMAEVRRLMADGALEDQAKLRSVSELLQGIHSFTTVSGEADEVQVQVDSRWQELVQAKKKVQDDQQRERDRTRDEAEHDKAKRERRKQLKAALSAYYLLINEKDYAAASAKALEIQAMAETDRETFAWHEDLELGPTLAKRLVVYVKVISKPPGAQVYVGSDALGKTPLAVEIGIGQELKIKVRAPGFRVYSTKLQGKEYAEVTAKLQTGPTWQEPVSDRPVLLLPWKKGVVAAAANGKLTCLSLVAGKKMWTTSVLAREQAPLAGIAYSGGSLIAARGRRVATYSLSKGELEWPDEKPEGIELPLAAKANLHAPVATRLGNRRRRVYILAGGQDLFVLNALNGKVLRHVTKLPAAVIQPPQVGGEWVYLALADRVVGLSLIQGDAKPRPFSELKKTWTAPDTVATYPLVHSKEADIVFVLLKDGMAGLGAKDGERVEVVLPNLGEKLIGMALDDRDDEGGLLICLGSNGLLCQVTGGTGEVERLNRRSRLDDPSGGPALLRDSVLVVNEKGELIRLNRRGKEPNPDKRIQLGKPVSAPLVVHGDALLAALGDTVCLIELKGD